MKMKKWRKENKMKKYISCAIVLFVILHLCGCSLAVNKLKYEIEDKNGEDIALAVLSDEDICVDLPGSYCLSQTNSWSGVEPSFPDEDFNDDRKNAHMAAHTPFSGVYIAQPTYGKTDTVVFSVSSDLSEGNLRLVLIDTTDYSIVGEFDVNTEDSLEVTNAKGKIFEFRVAGESAVFSLDVSREFK